MLLKADKGRAQRHKNARKGGKSAGRIYEDEEWRTVYIGFVERGTSSAELAKVFKDSGEIERLTLKEGFAFILFKEESSVALACKLDGTCLNGLNLRVAPRSGEYFALNRVFCANNSWVWNLKAQKVV